MATRVQKRRAAKKQRRKQRRQRAAQLFLAGSTKPATAGEEHGSGGEEEGEEVDEEALREYVAAALRWQEREREIESEKRQRAEAEAARRQKNVENGPAGPGTRLPAAGCSVEGERGAAEEEDEEEVEVEGLPEIVWGENEIVVKRRTVTVRRKKGGPSPAAAANQGPAPGAPRVHGTRTTTPTMSGTPSGVSPRTPSERPPGGGSTSIGASQNPASAAPGAPRLTLEQQQLLFRKGASKQHQQHRQHQQQRRDGPSAAWASGGAHAPVTTQGQLMTVGPGAGLAFGPVPYSNQAIPSLDSGQVKGGGPSALPPAHSTGSLSQPGAPGAARPFPALLPTPTLTLRRSSLPAPSRPAAESLNRTQQVASTLGVATPHGPSQLGTAGMGGNSVGSVPGGENAQAMGLDSTVQHQEGGAGPSAHNLHNEAANVTPLFLLRTLFQRHQQEQQRKAEACQLFTRTGACPFGPGCRRGHLYPPLERCCTILLPSLLSAWLDTAQAGPRDRAGAGAEESPASAPSPGTAPPLPVSGAGRGQQQQQQVAPDPAAQEEWVDLYRDLQYELEKYGEVYNLKVCCNRAPHLRGNVYCEYFDHQAALTALLSLQGRFFARRQAQCCLIPNVHWPTALCREHSTRLTQLSGADLARDGQHVAVGCKREEQAEGGCWYLHALINPQGEYAWADAGEAPPRRWQHEARVLHGPRDYAAALDQRRKSLGPRACDAGSEGPVAGGRGGRDMETGEGGGRVDHGAADKGGSMACDSGSEGPMARSQGGEPRGDMETGRGGTVEHGAAGKRGSRASGKPGVHRAPDVQERRVVRQQAAGWEEVGPSGQALRSDEVRGGHGQEGDRRRREGQQESCEDGTRGVPEEAEELPAEGVQRQQGDRKRRPGAVPRAERTGDKAEARRGSCSDTDSGHSRGSGKPCKREKKSKKSRKRDGSPGGEGAKQQEKKSKRRRPGLERGWDPEKKQAEEEEQRLRRLLLARQQALRGRPTSSEASADACSQGAERTDHPSSEPSHRDSPQHLEQPPGREAPTPGPVSPSNTAEEGSSASLATPSDEYERWQP